MHELGHYLVARLFDVHIEAFSFGSDHGYSASRRAKPIFAFCLIPMGGYVKMSGEQPGEIASADVPQMDPRSFPAKPRWQRLCIIFAGPAVNFVLAIGILAGLFMFQYPRIADPPRTGDRLRAAGWAAAKAGLKEGDHVIDIDGMANPTYEAIRRKELVGVGRVMKYTVERNGQRMTFGVTPVVVNQATGRRWQHWLGSADGCPGRGVRAAAWTRLIRRA
ncbi:MAG: site-2 protease family protein [Acidobacteriota bacterium]